MQSARAALRVVAIVMLFFSAPESGFARQMSPVMEANMETGKHDSETWRRLQDGDVIVDSSDEGETRFVSARILIHETPGNVWRVLTNPYEFEGKISPRMRDVEILHDASERSVMKAKVEIFPPLIPFITYTVESEYKPFEHVTFKRVAGSLKDFRGGWHLTPREGGLSTEVSYSMYVDPGMPLPQWIIRKAIKMELPRTLNALRDRIMTTDTAHGADLKTILAVGPLTGVAARLGNDSPVLGEQVRVKGAKKSKPVVKPRQVGAKIHAAEI